MHVKLTKNVAFPHLVCTALTKNLPDTTVPEDIDTEIAISKNGWTDNELIVLNHFRNGRASLSAYHLNDALGSMSFFCNMQDERISALKISKFSQKRSLVEFATDVYGLAGLQYTLNAFPVSTKLIVRQVS